MKHILLPIISLMGLYVYPQTDLFKPKFTSYSDRVSLSLTFINAANTFHVSDREVQQQKISFVPNTQKRFVASLDYQVFSLSVGFTPNFLKTQHKDLPSDQFHINTRINYKKWSQSLLYLYQKGFFVSYNDQNDVYAPDLRAYKIGSKTSYILNDNFSYRTVFSSNEWQNRSAGSFIAHFSFNYINLNFHKDITHNQRDILTFALIPSYYYNLVTREFMLLSSGIEAGGGVYVENGKAYAMQELSANFKIAYNHRSFFSFVGLSMNNLTQYGNSSQFNDSFAALKFGIGYRFAPPRKVESFYNRALYGTPTDN